MSKKQPQKKRPAGIESLGPRDPESADGRLVINVLAALAQFEREAFGERSPAKKKAKKR